MSSSTFEMMARGSGQQQAQSPTSRQRSRSAPRSDDPQRAQIPLVLLEGKRRIVAVNGSDNWQPMIEQELDNISPEILLSDPAKKDDLSAAELVGKLQDLYDLTAHQQPSTIDLKSMSAVWLDDQNLRHRDCAPAVIRTLDLANWTGKPLEEWYQKGKVERADGPALIWPDGRQEWFRQSRYNREDGPAVIRPTRDGAIREWYQGGLHHRQDGPAIEYPDGTEVWYQEGLVHREGGPAVFRPPNIARLERLASEGWYSHGQRHREDGPAIVWPDGGEHWYRHDQLDRGDGPAVVRPQPTADAEGKPFEEWYRHGHLHRQGGPAVSRSVNVARARDLPVEEWYTDGALHRQDGPARIWADGREEFYSNGQRQG